MAKSEVVEIAIDTININKQALVFASSKRGAEKTAEIIADELPDNPKMLEIANKLLNTLQRPTKQCERLFKCAKKGIVFHHAGLINKQRELIEDEFRSGNIKIISSTTTLAMGLDLPAFRVILKDIRRYSYRGMEYLPVMEYLQICGRAGRPGKEDFGEAIAIAKTEKEKEKIIEKFIYGEPEELYSKLAAEPILRTYLLSLIAIEYTTNTNEIYNFFEKTYWAHMYDDIDYLRTIIDKMLEELAAFKFIEIEEQDDFVTAENIKSRKVKSTLIGKRVAELYIDPLTANQMLLYLKRAKTPFSHLFMICNTTEMAPLLNVKSSEFEKVSIQADKFAPYIPDKIPEIYDEEYNEFLSIFKTAMLVYEWIEEKDENYILEKYNVRPGELNYKVKTSDWLIYAAEELAKLSKIKRTEISKTRMRLKYGVKEELLTLLKLKQIGRVRARKLYSYGYTDIGKIRKASIHRLAECVGAKIAIEIKKQLGEEINEIPKEVSRGQQTLSDFK